MLGRVLLVCALAAATWPAWRLLFLSPQPTIEQLREIICTTGPAGNSQPAGDRP